LGPSRPDPRSCARPRAPGGGRAVRPSGWLARRSSAAPASPRRRCSLTAAGPMSAFGAIPVPARRNSCRSRAATTRAATAADGSPSSRPASSRYSTRRTATYRSIRSRIGPDTPRVARHGRLRAGARPLGVPGYLQGHGFHRGHDCHLGGVGHGAGRPRARDRALLHRAGAASRAGALRTPGARRGIGHPGARASPPRSDGTPTGARTTPRSARPLA
jgi:hypothetical protein